MPFLNHLMIESVRGSNQRQLLNEFIYQDQEHGLIIAERRFITDYASIPKIIPRWFIDESDYYIREEAVIHDYLYDTCGLGGRLNREQCDQVLYRAMRESAMPWQIARYSFKTMIQFALFWLKAQIVYRAVRWFGGGHWQQST